MNSEHGNPFSGEKILENVESDIIFAISMGKRPAKNCLLAFDGKIQIVFGTHTHVALTMPAF